MNIIDQQNKYKTAIGGFIMAFAEVEINLTIIQSFCAEKNPKRYRLDKYFGNTLNKKIKAIDNFIYNCLTEPKVKKVSKRWQEMKNELLALNLIRNHLVHGIGFSSFYSENFTTMLIEDDKLNLLIKKTFTLEDLHAFTQRVHHVNTGEHGLRGHFLLDFRQLVLGE